MKRIVVTRYVGEQPAHRHVRHESVKDAKAESILFDVTADEYERLERGRPDFYRDLYVHGVVVMARKFDGTQVVVFVSSESLKGDK